MIKYRIVETEEKAVKCEGWSFKTPTPLLQVEDCEGYRYSYELAESDYNNECTYHKQLFDNAEDAFEYIKKELVSVKEFRDSWKHGKNFDEEISIYNYQVQEVRRDDEEDEWEFVEDLGGFCDELVCIHDSRKYEVIDYVTKTTTEFDTYDDADEFSKDLEQYSIILKLFKNGELDEKLEMNY